MNNNELLFAISEMMDNKLSVQLEPIKNDITDMKTDIDGLKADMVEVKSDIAGLKVDVADLKADMVEVKSDIADLKADMVEVKSDIADLKTDVQRTNIILENEISPAIKLLAENYLPAAIRYESSNKEHEEMKADIELLKKVVTEHSEKLQKIS